MITMKTTSDHHLSLVPIILCGGSGTRLWPLSRAGFPKQFLALTGENTLFQQALIRSQAIADSSILLQPALIVTNEEHRFLALDQLRELKQSCDFISAQFLLEPVGKNTAPALTLAALSTLGAGSEVDPILLVTPADQTIENQDAFVDAIRRAVLEANKGAIVVMGIRPVRAETGYGYIQRQGAPDAYGAYRVSQFTEKPNAALANDYLANGDYYWNGGIFVLKASVWLRAIQTFRPDIANACQKAWQHKTVDNTANHASFMRPYKEAFLEIPSESIDYAVIEKCPTSEMPMVMVPLDAGWNDLGSWDAVWQVGNANTDGNVTRGDVLTTHTKNSLAIASSRLVSLVGVNDLVVVETADAILIAKRNSSQEVKEIVSQLEHEGREEKNLHRKVNRPWGWYDSVDEGDRFKVKRIQVNPGASLSLQMHHHRAEHWIVVKGVARITNGDKVTTLTENQSTYIPHGQLHRLENPGNTPLEIIEVQSGNYLGEDDIVRFEDTYGRS
jgi:mannose-1-phosphate guanylyltransferase/mannose-6-phosphate isomerase